MTKQAQSPYLLHRLGYFGLLFLFATVIASYLLDEQLFSLINPNSANPYLDRIVMFGNDFGITIQLIFVILPLVVLIAYYESNGTDTRKTVILLLILFLTFLCFELIRHMAVDIIKESVGRPRPFLELEARVIDSAGYDHPYQSFPSGHSSSSFFFFFISVYLIYRLKGLMSLPRYLVPALMLFSFGFAFLRGFGRIYLGCHYPSDVVCGAMIALVFSEAGIISIERLREKNILILDITVIVLVALFYSLIWW